MSIQFDLGQLQAAGFTADQGRIDLDLLGEIIDDFGLELMDEVAESLFSEAEQAFVSLDAAVASGNAEECGALMHFLKGSVQNLGMAEFANLCQAGEAAAKAGTLPTAEQVAALRASYAASKENILVLQGVIQG